MNRFFIVVILLLPQIVLAQLRDSFSDGNFTQNFQWHGDSSQFIVNSLFQLQSQGQTGNTSIYLYTPSQRLKNTSWEFYVQLPFASSTTNYAKIYLSSDQSNLKGNLNGYYIKIGGESGNYDGIDLFRQSSNTNSKIIDGIAGHAGKNNNTLRIKVSRDNTGNWELYSDTTGGNHFLKEGEVFDTTFQISSYAGVVYYFSSTRRNQFYFDDFIIEQAPLKAEKAKSINDSTIQVWFNNPIDSTTTTNPLNYQLGIIGPPLIVKNVSASSVLLHYNHTIPNGQYTVQLQNIADTTGRLMNLQNLIFQFTTPLKYGDLLITEIYADPTPSNGLPEEEYIEIYNASAQTIDISGFLFSDGTSSSIFPPGNLSSGEYLLLCPSDGLNFYEKLATSIPLAPWPSLNNSGDNLSLKDKEGNMLFELNYQSSWYNDIEKAAGGWALEMMHLEEYCKGKNNWSSSQNPLGGTPGKINSINITLSDTIAPYHLTGYLIDSVTVKISFNESISIIDLRNNFITNSSLLDSIDILNENELILHWNSPFPINQKTILQYNGIKDCIGNTSSGEISIVRAGTLDSADIIINEILFNPKPDEIDFVEIYNRSSDILDLQSLSLESIKEDGQIISCPMVNTAHYLYPHSYKVLCSSSLQLQQRYVRTPVESIIEIPKFPAYNDNSGIVALKNQGQLVDIFFYKESYHSALLKDKEGISLERISFEQSASNPANWHSASSLVDFATPGFENSMHYENPSDQTVYIDPAIITPDGDNYKDIAFINFRFEEVGNYCSIKIFNSSGMPVKKLADNFLIGEEGFFLWDGLNNEGEIVPTGIYILLIEYFNPSGSKGQFKRNLVVYSD